MIVKNLQTKGQIIASFIAFILIIALADNVLKDFRLDLTENKLYTLSDGTVNIVSKVEDSIKLKLYYSNSLTKDDSYLRSYSKRVIEFLQSYEYKSDGKIKLEVIDPIPFSDEEDLAMKYGLQSVPMNDNQDNRNGLNRSRLKQRNLSYGIKDNNITNIEKTKLSEKTLKKRANPKKHIFPPISSKLMFRSPDYI